MSKAIIRVNNNGSYVVTGNFEIVDAEGKAFNTKKAVALCRCGLSSSKPFCDGTHRKKNFQSIVKVTTT